jgi:hypothetical protein
MIKRILLATLAPLLPLIPSIVAADNDVSVLDISVDINFPVALVFNLEAESSADIVDARLHYQVDKMNSVSVTSEGWADFSPATKIKTSWTWDMRKSSLPPGAAITYWWTIQDEAGNNLQSPPAVACFEDVRYDWQSLASAGFAQSQATFQDNDSGLTLFWYEGDGSFATELMQACEQGLGRLIENIGTYPEKPIKIYVYASTSDLQGAMFGIIAIGISPGQLDWGKRALVHELTHLIVHQAIFSPYGELPAWLDEGLAMYNEGALATTFEVYLQQAISEDELISVRSLCSPFSAEPEQAYVSYAQSYSLVEYLLDSYGQARMLNLLTLLKQGNTYDEALTLVYGFDIDGLDARWHETVTATASAALSQGPERSEVAAKQTHPALIAVLSALATCLALAGALALEKWDWQRAGQKG